MIKAIIFDCFGVLYVNPAYLFYETYVPDYQKVKPELLDLNKQADYGFITQTELAEQVAAISGLDNKFVQANIMGNHTLNTALLDFAQSARSHHKVGLLSNISAGSMDSFFNQQQREDYFDSVVLSGDVGVIKPDVKIYQIMADTLGIAPDGCIMIDDSLDNCYGADAAGMKWVHYQDTSQCIKEINQLITGQ